MRFFSMLGSLLLAETALAQNTSCSPKSSDAEVVEYAYALQGLLERYYTSQPINQTFLHDATNGSRVEYYQNILGIQRQNRLGVRALQVVGAKVPGFSNPRCDYSVPRVSSGEQYVKNALTLEGDVAAALIGATAYTQSPEVSLILARLAAVHTADATWLAAELKGVIFPSNISSLVPAFNPAYVLGSGNESGRLGRYLDDCVSPPSSPCNQPFFIGPLVGSVGNRTSAAAGPSSSVASPSISPTAAAKRRFAI
ncbi:hypothetical protein BDW74DRAFT_125948 [Aspergillus multicolor]|uniref:uncharacterized protein n=1 Tax=Aspergillus multicolor TaxID=41759 RepID=UPI003CCCEA92